MMQKTMIFLSGILATFLCVANQLPEQSVQFGLTLNTTAMPTVEVDLPNQHLNIGQLKLDKDHKLPAFKSEELQGRVSLSHSNALEVSLTCHNQKNGHCVLYAMDTGGSYPACTIGCEVCLSTERGSPVCDLHLNNHQIQMDKSRRNMPFSIYVQGSGGDLIQVGSQSEKFVGRCSLKFKASFI